MKQRNAQGQYAKAEHVDAETLMAALAGMDLTKLVTKVVIGYVFAITAFVAAADVAMTLALMTSVVWLQYVIQFAVLCALAYSVIRVTPWVADTVYDAGAYIGAKAKLGYSALKTKVEGVKATKWNGFAFRSEPQHATH
jgi:hypothetical protein